MVECFLYTEEAGSSNLSRCTKHRKKMTDKKIDPIVNRFDLILAGSIRVRELKKGHRPKIATKNRECVTAVNEFEQGLIGKEYLKRIK